ncbi:MAG TPA: TIM barrel protein [Planctomycetota bacterium]|nr:TIM barrel protein [Planctomycetota bacterium]
MIHPDRRSLIAAAGLASLAAAAPRPQEPPARLPGRTPHTRFAVNIEMWFGGRPYPERMRAAAALGFPAVEFWPWRGKDLDAIDATRRELDLEIAQFTGWGFTPPLCDPANHAAFVEELRAAAAVANRLGAKCMTVLAGNDQPGMEREQMHDHLIAGLKLGAPVAEDADVVLILEPLNTRVDHRGYCLSSSDDAVRICREVGSTHVKINWDLYHQQITEGDLCGHLREGFDAVGYVQLADHPGRHEPGTGEIHYNRVLRELHDLGYRGLVGLECSPRDGEAQAAERVAAADVW